MKKIRLLLLIPSLLLGSCNGGDSTTINLLVPTGAPALTFYNFKDDARYTFETNTNPQAIIAAMKGNPDVNAVVLPTNAGIQAIKTGADYKIAATLTFGNFFVCATGNDDDDTMNAGDTVILFQQNNIPDYLFKDVYSDIYDSLNIKYVNAASDASGVLTTGTYIEELQTINADYVLVADPAMRKSLIDNPNASIYASIQDLFKLKHDNKEITQASLFVKNTLSKDSINNLLNKLSEDISYMISDAEGFNTKLSSWGSNTEISVKFGAPAPMVKISLLNGNGIGVGFKKAIDNKDSIDQFLSIIAPSIGITDEEIYYK